ncbi:MAG: glycerophosphodiester phosphodiesterase family protein [Cyclobacteriaceae bacterium]
MVIRFLVTAFFIFSILSCTDNEKQNTEETIGKFSSVEATKEYFRWQESAPRLISAHRGGPYPGYPENSIEAFNNVLENTEAIIECDVAVTRDGMLIMMHDDKLDRTTTGAGLVNKKTWEEIKSLKLKDYNNQVTEFSIPSLEEVLNWSKGKAFLTLDIKRGVSLEKVNELISKTGTAANVAIITYSFKKAKEVHQINPDLMISITARNMDDIKRIKESGIAIDNLIAFTGISELDKEVYDALHEMGIYAMLGALGNLDRRAQARGDSYYITLYARGADILATDRPIEVAGQLRQPTN